MFPVLRGTTFICTPNFRKNGFALRLVLKQRHKGIRKLPIVFVVIAAAVIVLGLGSIVSVLCSIVLSNGFKPFMRDITRAAT